MRHCLKISKTFRFEKFDTSLGYVAQSLYILTSHAGFARLDLQDFSVN